MKFSQLPFFQIEDGKTKEKFKNNKFLLYIIDSLDDNLWSSKISFISNLFLIFLIILSSLEIVLNSDSTLSEYKTFFYIIYLTTSIFFTIEIISRLILARYIDKNNRGFSSSLNYIFSFYGIIDILSIIPFLLGLYGLHHFEFLKIVRILRIWRIVRYIPAFKSITNAFKSKRDEILVSLMGVILLSITLSAFIFYAETNAGSTDFKSILGVFTWSIGKYTGDYGSIAYAVPITILGKFLATLNGLLGIALFAIPAGLLGSAFIDEIGETKKQNEVTEKVELVNKYFLKQTASKKKLKGKKAQIRYISFETLQAKLLFTEEETFETIKGSKNLRFRSMKSDEKSKFNDIKIIERFETNTPYGYKLINENSPVYIINSIGSVERCISHFIYTIADNLNTSFISREKVLIDNSGEDIGCNFSEYYGNYEKLNKSIVSNEFDIFMNDIQSIHSDQWVIIISSGSRSHSADIIFEYGQKKGTAPYTLAGSTLQNMEKIKLFESIIENKLIDSEELSSVKIGHNLIGNYDQQWIGPTVHRLTNAQTLTIYINIDLLTSADSVYYNLLGVMIDSIDECFLEKKVEEN
jgi:voltage-gated potassium channel